MNSTNTLGKKYAPVGAMFMKVGATKGTWKLGDIKPVVDTITNPNMEYFQQFDPVMGTTLETKYTYIDANRATKMPFKNWPVDPVGWWVKPTSGNFTGTPTTRADDVEFKAGEGLYSNFGGGVKLDFSGEVVTEEWQLDLTDKKYVPIINYLARPVTLGEIVPETDTITNPNMEYLQQFDPNLGTTLETKYTYIDENRATKMPFKNWPVNAVGWWVKPVSGNFGGTPTTRADNIVIEPGSGFYSNFGGGVKLNFPSSIPTAE